MQLLFDIETTMRDGVVLRGDAWIDDRPRPAILIRTHASKDRFGHELIMPVQCARAGYAVLVQDIRGRFASEGAFTGSMKGEAEDTYDTVEWMAQQPWCDGRVGMVGASYSGALQVAAAMLQPPHLSAVSPALAPIEEYDRELLGGTNRFSLQVSLVGWLAIEWAKAQAAAGRITPAEGEHLRRLGLSSTLHEQLVRALPTKTVMRPFQGFAQTLATNPADQVPFRPERLTVPALFVTGWFDYACTSTLRAFQALHEQARRDAAPMRHRLIVGPWVHDWALPHYAGDLVHGAAGAGIYSPVCEDQLAFFAEHLTGASPATRPIVRYFVIGAEEWRVADCWPPRGVATERWYLRSNGSANTAGGDGRLERAPATVDEPADRFDYDPSTPLPSHGGDSFRPSAPGPLNQQHLEARSDVLCYTSAPLESPRDLIGPINARLFAASSAVDTDFYVRLIDLFPDGRAILVAFGARRARHRHGLEHEELLEPGRVEEYAIALGHVAWRFLPGHCMRIHVTSSHFPARDRNMNTGRLIGIDRKWVVAHQTVMHSAEHPSSLEISILPGAEDAPSATTPPHATTNE